MAWWKFWGGSGPSGSDKPDYYTEGVELAGEALYHEALTSFRLALREDPEDVATLEQMAIAYTRMGMTDEAIRMYRRALEIQSDSGVAHYGVAFLLLNRGRETEAAAHLDAFLKSDSRKADSERYVEHARETLARLRGGSEERADAPAGERAEGDAGNAGGEGDTADDDRPQTPS